MTSPWEAWEAVEVAAAFRSRLGLALCVVGPQLCGRIPAASLFCPGLGGAPEWVLLQGPGWGPGSPAAIHSGGQGWAWAATQLFLQAPWPHQRLHVASRASPAQRGLDAAPSSQGTRWPPTQAGAEKQKSLLSCHPPSTRGSRPPVGGASPLTHACIYSREMRHGQSPCGSPGRRVTPPHAPLPPPPGAWRPLVDTCRGSLPLVGPSLSERMRTPKEAGRCRGIGSLQEAGGPSCAPHHRLNLGTPSTRSRSGVCPAWPRGQVRPEERGPPGEGAVWAQLQNIGQGSTQARGSAPRASLADRLRAA